MTSIRLSDVSKSYGDNPPVLRDVNLEIGDGELAVFIGPSGCGKSTLLRLVAGLEEITRGDLYIGGRRVNDVSPAERGIAMVFQSYALFPHMTVYENMAFGLELAGRPRAEIEAKVREAARILQLEEYLDRRPKALSGGQRQRVAIGRAIVRQPNVFLLDEPLSNLDTALRAQTRIEIARLHKDFKTASMIYVTHDQIEAMTLAQRIVLLHAGADVQRKGSVAQVGSPLELFHYPRKIFTAGFIGSPRMNFLRGQVLEASAAGVDVRLDAGEVLRVAVDGARLGRGARVTAGIRPEHVVPAGGAEQTLSGVVGFVERLGTATYLYLDRPGQDLFVAAAKPEEDVRPGQPVTLGVPARACHLFDEAGEALRRSVTIPV
jgi:multiple sugar transport system ATP-binding protein